jgi:hypothetical protein
MNIFLQRSEDYYRGEIMEFKKLGCGGFYAFDAGNQNGYINKRGGVWEVQVNKEFNGKMSFRHPVARAHTFADAKQKAAEMFGGK